MSCVREKKLYRVIQLKRHPNGRGTSIVYLIMIGKISRFLVQTLSAFGAGGGIVKGHIYRIYLGNIQQLKVNSENVISKITNRLYGILKSFLSN
jgi:hypothetical protein